MTTLIIMAAGRGSRMGRVGDALHKCLVPLNGRAIISHQLALVPDDIPIIIGIGYRGEQIRDYIRVAHPERDVTFVDVEHWDVVGRGGPGLTLVRAMSAMDYSDDVLFTSCDTLWDMRDIPLFDETETELYATTWVGIAPVPIGTHPTRWCRFVVDDMNYVSQIIDKRPTDANETVAYVGLAHIARDDIAAFRDGILNEELLIGERQVSSGLQALLNLDRNIMTRHITWTDVGDEQSYHNAVARLSGYDWTKIGQATYVLQQEQRVVKFASDRRVLELRQLRGEMLHSIGVVPKTLHVGSFIAYSFINGISAYAAAEEHGIDVTDKILKWYHSRIWPTRRPTADTIRASAMAFYRDKTIERISMLNPNLQGMALSAVHSIDWDGLAYRAIPGLFHGDFNMGNIILDEDGRPWGIDWRENFSDRLEGDLRYDIAKFLAGTVVHWDNAQRGDFRPWNQARAHAAAIKRFIENALPEVNIRDIEVIGALSLLNSAPLHASPLDEVLVVRGIAWLDKINH